MALKDDHAIIHSASIPALSAVISMGEKSPHDLPSDVIRDLKESRDKLQRRDAARAAARAATHDSRRANEGRSEAF